MRRRALHDATTRIDHNGRTDGDAGCAGSGFCRAGCDGAGLQRARRPLEPPGQHHELGKRGISLAWRTALADAGALPQESTDEAWSQRVGNVSSQHVGPLRRVCERFTAVKDSYAGLFWSHFQAALDWQDAECGWRGPCKTSGRWPRCAASDGKRWAGCPRMSRTNPTLWPPTMTKTSSRPSKALSAALAGSTSDDADAIDDDAANLSLDETTDGPVPFDADAFAPEEVAARPFAHLAALPDDLAEAFEAFKLAIVRHRLDGWRTWLWMTSCMSIDALKSLALSAGAGDL